MQNEYIDFISASPLSKAMIVLLKECQEREIKNQQPPDALLPCASGLIRRKLVPVKPYTDIRGKSVMSIYISEQGKKNLND